MLRYRLTADRKAAHAAKECITMGRKLFVGNLATGRARGFAFVEMRTEDDARRATSELADADVGGRKLTVNEAGPRPVSPSRGS
jgi:RNA recognition motif-containing protein